MAIFTDQFGNVLDEGSEFDPAVQQIVMPDMDIVGTLNASKSKDTPKDVTKKLAKAIGRKPAELNDYFGRNRAGAALVLDTLEQNDALSRGRQARPQLSGNKDFTGMSLADKLGQIRSEEAQGANLTSTGLGAELKGAQFIEGISNRKNTDSRNATLDQANLASLEQKSLVDRLKLAQANNSLSNKDIINILNPASGIIGGGDNDEELREQLMRRLLGQ